MVHKDCLSLTHGKEGGLKYPNLHDVIYGRLISLSHIFLQAFRSFNRKLVSHGQIGFGNCSLHVRHGRHGHCSRQVPMHRSFHEVSLIRLDSFDNDV